MRLRECREEVAIAYVHGDHCSMSWHHSMEALSTFERIPVEGATGEIASARNSAVRQFLSKTKPWLWFVDCDMGFRADIIERLHEEAERNEALVVGALCYTVNRGLADGMGGHETRAIPTILNWRRENDGFEPFLDYEEDAPVKCDATGSAAILIHRSVFERIKDAEGEVWYHRIRSPISQNFFGEDLSFCLRLRKLGIPVYVHTGIQTSHAKTLWVSSRQYQLERFTAIEREPLATNGAAFNMLPVR